MTIALGGGLPTGGCGSAVARSCGQIEMLLVQLSVVKGGCKEIRINRLRQPAAQASRHLRLVQQRLLYSSRSPCALACSCAAPAPEQERCLHAAFPGFARCCVRFTVFCPLVFADMCAHCPSSLLLWSGTKMSLGGFYDFNLTGISRSVTSSELGRLQTLHSITREGTGA